MQTVIENETFDRIEIELSKIFHTSWKNGTLDGNITLNIDKYFESAGEKSIEALVDTLRGIGGKRLCEDLRSAVGLRIETCRFAERELYGLGKARLEAIEAQFPGEAKMPPDEYGTRLADLIAKLESAAALIGRLIEEKEQET